MDWTGLADMITGRYIPGKGWVSGSEARALDVKKRPEGIEVKDMKALANKMYTYDPKTAGKQIAATVSNGKAPQLKKKATVIPANPQGRGNKEKVAKAVVASSPVVVDTREDVMALQRRLGFKGKDVDGVVGPMTNAAENKAGINLAMTNADAFAPTPKQTIVKQPVQKAQQAQVVVPAVEAKQAYGGMTPEESAKLEAFTVDHNKRVLAGKQAVADSGLSNGWSSDGGGNYSDESEYAKAQSDAALEKQWKAEEAINRAGLAQELVNAKFARQATKQTYM